MNQLVSAIYTFYWLNMVITVDLLKTDLINCYFIHSFFIAELTFIIELKISSLF